MKYFRILFAFVVLITFKLSAICQNDPLLRIEIDSKTDNAQYSVIPCSGEGALLFYPTTIEEDEYQFWIAVFYDRFLQESWKKNLPLFKNMRFRDYFYDNDLLYLFFYVPTKQKSDLYNFQLARIDLNEGMYELFSGNLPENARTISFHVHNGNIYTGLNLEKEEAGIYSFNLQSREVKTIFATSGTKSRLEHIFIDTVQSSLVALFNIYDSKTSFFMQLATFELNGSPIETVNVMPDPGRKFNTGKVIVNELEKKRIILGTYEPIKGETVDAKHYFSKKASGFFVTTIDENAMTSTRFENFLDLEKMTGYLRSREYMQAKLKAEKKDNTESASLGYNLLLHDIVVIDSLLFLLAEGYFEEYHTLTNTYYDFYGRSIPFTQTVFDGYRHFNAFLSCYDFSGEKLWDNGMEIFDILSFDLRKRVHIHFVDSAPILFYNHDGKISSKILTGSDKQEGVTNNPIESTYVNDKLMTDTKSDIIPWYDNYFIAYGFQTIRNNSLSNSRRSVFYMNKVELR
jgi:hypothetical protein